MIKHIACACALILSLSAHAVEYTPDTGIEYDIIQMHDLARWEQVCQSFTGSCDVPAGLYQVKLLDRNWNLLHVIPGIEVEAGVPQPAGGFYIKQLQCAPENQPDDRCVLRCDSQAHRIIAMSCDTRAFTGEDTGGFARFSRPVITGQSGMVCASGSNLDYSPEHFMTLTCVR